MKILMLHLSDTHISSSKDTNLKRINKLVDSLNILGKFDECIIIYSGDLANSGNQNEYSLVERFLGSIISKIKHTYLPGKIINTLIVPGNHDVEFKDMKRERNDVIELYKKGEIDSHIDNELKLLDKFFIFAKRNRCYIKDKIIDRRIINFNGYLIGANLINSAIFCDKKDDKGIHYISDEYIEKLYDYSKLDLIISISHYSHEWYSQDCKNKLECALYRNSSIIFLGHEHVESDKSINIGEITNGNTIDISAGGIFNDHKNVMHSEYIAKIVDTDENTLETYNFTWSTDFYKHNFISKKKITKILSRSEKIMPSDNFVQRFLVDTKHNLTKNCLDYFTFPRIKKNEYDESKYDYEICDSDKLLNEINLKKKIIIVGDENSGKTTLMKHLYMILSESKIPLYFSADEIRNKRISNIIKSAFEDQYSEEPADFSKFQQLCSNYKIAIIDDINCVKLQYLNAFIEEVSRDFDYIIMSTITEWDFDIMKNVKKRLSKKEEFSSYRLEWFYSDKRKELIDSICRVYVKNENIEIDIDETVTNINNFIKNQLSIFSLTPDFIIQYIYFYFNGIQTNDKNGSIFSKVYELNIVNSIKNCISDISVDRVLMVLDKIAYYIHFNKRYPLPYQELDTMIKEYNSRYRQNIKTRILLDGLKDAKILKDCGENFEVKFVNKNILAFFVAREIVNKYKNEDDIEGLNFVLNNICFGINSDIVLFISYIENNKKLLRAIFNNANDYLSSWDEYSIDNGNIEFLDKMISEIKVDPPTKKDKEYEDKMETKAEQSMHNDEIVETTDIYDYDEADVNNFSNKLIKALNHTMIMAKILTNFEYMLDVDDISYFIKAIYSFPNKIIYLFVKYINDNLPKLIKEAKSFEEEINMNDEGQHKELSENDIRKIFEEISICMISSLYYGVSRVSSDKNTIAALKSFDFNGNTNYMIQNMMMLENVNDIEGFIRKADVLFSEKSKYITKVILKQMVRKCLMEHENISYGKRQHLLNKYFGKEERYKMLIEGDTSK